jgi:hypothetical protein
VPCQGADVVSRNQDSVLLSNDHKSNVERNRCSTVLKTSVQPIAGIDRELVSTSSQPSIAMNDFRILNSPVRTVYRPISTRSMPGNLTISLM